MPSFKKMEPMSRALRPGGAGVVNPQDVGGGLDLGTMGKQPKQPGMPKMPRAPSLKAPRAPQMPKMPGGKFR